MTAPLDWTTIPPEAAERIVARLAEGAALGAERATSRYLSARGKADRGEPMTADEVDAVYGLSEYQIDRLAAWAKTNAPSLVLIGYTTPPEPGQRPRKGTKLYHPRAIERARTERNRQPLPAPTPETRAGGRRRPRPSADFLTTP